jgi:hypothetical protein
MDGSASARITVTTARQVSQERAITFMLGLPAVAAFDLMV